MSKINIYIIERNIVGCATSDEISALHSWLERNKSNRDAYFRMKNIWDACRIKGYSQDEIHREWELLARRIGRTDILPDIRQTTDRKPVIRRWMRYAAMIAIVIGFASALVWLLYSYSSSQNVSQQVTYQQIMVAEGKRTQVILADSSKVWLNAGAILKYPSDFNNNNRTVIFDGEAFFDVAHNPSAPFVVQTSKKRITVLGTTFNVMDYSADDFAVTTLVSGSVVMQTVSETGKPEKEYVLEQNQQAFFDKTISEVTLYNVIIDPNSTHVNKVYQFRDRPLLEITQRLEKLYDVKIHIADENLKNVEYSGTFQTHQSIEEVLMFLNFGNQFSYTIENQLITIMSNE